MHAYVRVSDDADSKGSSIAKNHDRSRSPTNRRSCKSPSNLAVCVNPDVLLLGGKCVLITGAAGMIGKAGFHELRAMGVRVVGYDNLSAPQSIVDVIQDGDCSYVQGELSDTIALQEACRGCDVVVHSGRISGPGHTFEPPVPATTVARTNISGTLNVLAAALACGVRRVVFAPSGCVYAPVERERILPSTVLSKSTGAVESTDTFGASMISGEQLCRAYSAQKSFDTVSLRIGSSYGPCRTSTCVVRSLLNGEPCTRPLDDYHDLVYVDDVARAVSIAAMRECVFGGIAINIGGGYLALAEIEFAVAKALGHELKTGDRVYSVVKVALPAMDLSLAFLVLGWKAKISIEDGVQKLAKRLECVASRKRDFATVCVPMPGGIVSI